MFGLLAMFGAIAGSKLPAFSVGALGRSTRPADVQDWYIARAAAKRNRRANSSHASKYAIANAAR